MIIRFEGKDKEMVFANSIGEMHDYMKSNNLIDVKVLWIADSLESPLMINWNRKITINECEGIE